MKYNTHQVHFALEAGTLSLPQMVAAELIGAGKALEILLEQPYSLELKNEQAEEIIKHVFSS